ncbi:hypothetical protein FWJ32_06080 [Calorimonas adulescens]|uniref:Exo-alpha-sialidase n=1 Tax=Calorimonas adulescens TaxID=2606906 RepID=A0A5D8QDR1_9THEO|nr:hypothetical protein FWJ32_06080 [Calorimonas adulescens]
MEERPGQLWSDVKGNINQVYSRVLTGIGFANDKIGFLCFRYESADFTPAICRTQDGWITWKKVSITLPSKFDGYGITPLSPAFDGLHDTLPLLLYREDGTNFIIYLTSNDYGKTWTYDETSQSS